MSDKMVEMEPLKSTKHDAIGELVPARTELRDAKGDLVAVIFETVACHNYTTLEEPKDYRRGSLDLLIEMYYALHFAELMEYKTGNLLCVIQGLIKREHDGRVHAVVQGLPAHDVFPLECIGHQPQMPELKKAHRDRVRDKKKELVGALRFQGSGSLAIRRKRE